MDGIKKSVKTGGCHCGAVRWQGLLPDEISVQRCNCSICAMTGFVHLIIPKRDFTLLSGKDCLTEYRFNTKVARHFFCEICGVKSYYVPRSNPDGYSLNLNCMDQTQFANITVDCFDGRNWEAHADQLKHLSK
ncbi:MAG: GFA family protein [bacterium]